MILPTKLYSREIYSADLLLITELSGLDIDTGVVPRDDVELIMLIYGLLIELDAGLLPALAPSPTSPLSLPGMILGWSAWKLVSESLN